MRYDWPHSFEPVLIFKHRTSAGLLNLMSPIKAVIRPTGITKLLLARQKSARATIKSANLDCLLQRLKSIALTTLLLFSSTIFALDANQTLSQLHHTEWTTRTGAPGDVEALAQDADGSLWVGTGSGLYSFDGVTFRRFSSAPGEAALRDDISVLYTTPNNDLWIGTRLGTAYLLRRGHLTSFGVSEGLSKHTLWNFVQDFDGRIWALNNEGIYVLKNAHWAPVAVNGESAPAHLRQLVIDRNGTLWATSSNGRVFSLQRGEKSFSRGQDTDGEMAFTDSKGYAWSAGTVMATSLTAPTRNFYIPSIKSAPLDRAGIFFIDREDSAWMATEHGLFRVQISKLEEEYQTRSHVPFERPPFKDGITNLSIYSALEDREGNVWFGTATGLQRFRDNKFLSQPDTSILLDGASVATLSDGSVWLAAESNGLIKVGDKLQRTHIMEGRGPKRQGLIVIQRGPDESLWLGGYGQLNKLHAGVLSKVELPFADSNAPFQSIAVSATSEVWISVVGHGIWAMRNGQWFKNGDNVGLPEGPSLCIAIDPDKSVWLGYPDDRLVKISGRTVQTFSATEGLSVGNVLVVYPTHDLTWVGGRDGVMLYRNGRFHALRTKDHLEIVGVTGIVEATNGDIWLNGTASVVRLSSDDVAALKSDPDRVVEAQTFDSADGRDGTPPQLAPLNSATRSADGRLWFTTQQNVYWIDPDHVSRNSIPPHVFISAIGSRSIDEHIRSNLRLAKATTELNIEYGATSLKMPERVRFRYRLDGVDAGWQEAGTRREARYTNLSAGSYRFQVIACNEDNVWNTTGASVSFSIAAAYYQTIWFQAVCAVFLTLVIAMIGLMRIQQIAARMRVQVEARSRERERIARDLHDTMLQGTQGLVLSFQVLANKLPQQDATRRGMEDILDQADEVIAQVRDSVLNLRASASEALSLPQRLQEVVDELNFERQVSASLIVSGETWPLAQEVGEEVYRIGREALLNAFRHSKARRIDAQLTYAAARLVLEVLDDGIGIEQQVLSAGARPGHWGLIGMRERAVRIGGTLIVGPRELHGTLVKLTVPSANAMAKVRSIRAWRWRPAFMRQ